jgi:2-polyprenyl-3-methyl-5-hydroxy-6-metoxy-1,4-benzoquinol methylase
LQSERAVLHIARSISGRQPIDPKERTVSLDEASLASAEIGFQKPVGYYTNTRAELIPLIPASAMQILEVGCAEGVFANSLREARKPRRPEIVGVEINRSAALKAEEILDAVFVGNIEELDLPFHEHFDCVVLADVLEHLIDPWKTLEKVKTYLRPGGCVVSSIPNIQNWRVVLGLLKGSFEYKNEGILDNTHLRFFTREGVRSLFETARLRIEVLRARVPTSKGRALNSMTGGLLEPFLAFQYHVRAKHAGAFATKSIR